ncbi:TPA: EamA family transporter [Candidatus Woesearchaeota archaeon]|nr:hypothetical protein QT06_C0001G0529 [archaeon GW2011_AR15]MBS3103840.1 EamA family transporter [Candidatus Woesearchaeota archaeon]HIH40834.1 EamA family transporter [Candidatus Woesearchaeota archaeon]
MKHHKGILLALLTTFFTAAGQFFLKDGTGQIPIAGIINISLLIGIVLYAGGAVVLIFALRHGELNMIYPMISLSLVWVTLISYFLLNESITPARIAGNALILTGVIFITRKHRAAKESRK